MIRVHGKLWQGPGPYPPGEGGKKPGGYWVSFPHGTLISHFKQAAEWRRVALQNETIAISADGLELAAVWNFDHPDCDKHPDLFSSLCCGIVNSNASRSKTRVVWGCVDLSGNAVPLGATVVGKHTMGVLADIDLRIGLAMDRMLFRTGGRMAPYLRRLQTKKTAVAKAEQKLLVAGRKGILPWSRIGTVIRETRSNPVSVWDLYMRFIKEAQRGPTWKQIDACLTFLKITKGIHVHANRRKRRNPGGDGRTPEE